MNIPEEFGKYLLLKKLVEDPLGETFRAGKVGQEGMEQVVLLRVLNGKGIDGEKLWARISGRAGLQSILKSPNIGNGVDLGRVRSFPYTAYDYISGKNLASVFLQAARQHSPVPTDHALLIAERISLALAAASESRFQDERVMHGFVVPQLVMISNEGETRLLGFEVAPGLRELAAGGWQDEGLRPYLAPEALAGAAPSRADDVYSLGAILYELLIGERLPASPAAAPGGSFDVLIDAAELPNEGTPLPAPVAALLKKSLTGREQRIADAVTWHKTLSKLMIDGHFSPTTFNLAFFMHNLFREEIERESQEMQAEKKLELPKRQPASATPPVAVAPAAVAATGREATGVREATLSGTFAGNRSQAAPEPSKKGVWIGLAAVLVLALLAGGGWFLFGRSTGSKVASAPPATPAPAAALTPGAAPADSAAAKAAAEAQIKAQIQQMVDAGNKEVEAKLKTQYDDRIKLLQKQLEDTRKGNSERQTAAVPSAPPETRAAIRNEPPPVPAPEKPVVTAPQPTPTPAERQASQPPPVQEKPAAPAPAPAPRPAQVQAGDLVQPGPGVAAPKLLGQLEPRYPPAAQRLNRAAQVHIKVLVDERGRVMDAEGLGAKAGFGFDEAALDAARRASFQPATKEGVKVKMWMTLQVNFNPPVH
ncbi:MAG TPA: TonB family protein [Thermoanaerobaculia bacterium]|nr:TonB family protein [Thermoanaerobaculia bacterium]